jgi:Leucine-rich repeat (LRR) protein
MDDAMRNAFLKAASFPALEELVWPDFNKGSAGIPGTIRDVWCNSVHIPHSRLGEVLTFPRFRANFMTIQTVREDAGSKRVACRNEVDSVVPEITPVNDRGEPLPAKELASLKKLLRDDSPETVMKGLEILHAATPATIDALLEKSMVKWDDRNVGHFGGYVSGRLGGPLFDSLKRNDLGEAVRMNLLSLASPGFQPVDDIRKEIRDITLPPPVVPIDVSGFNGIWKLKITVDTSKPTKNWIAGLEKLTTLRALEMELTGGGYGSKLEKAFPLGFTPPVNVTEMSIDLNYQEVKVKPDFITVSPNLRKLKIDGVWPLADIPLLKGLDPSMLEELILDYDSSSIHLPAEDLTSLAAFENLQSISGSRKSLRSLKGISGFKKLKSLILKTEQLEDISELSRVSTIESVELDGSSTHEVSIGDLVGLASLVQLDLGGHRVTDPMSLLKFRPETTIRIKGLDNRIG